MSTTTSIGGSSTAEPTTSPIEKKSSRLSQVRPIKGFRWILVCISLYITCFLYGLDTTIAADLAWVGAGFPLGSVAVVLPLTAAFVNFNLRWTYVATVIIFEAGSVLCGAAPNMNAIIIGRRGTYITLIGFCWGIGAVLGPVVGGAFSVSSATWRWAFYINLVIGGALTPIYLFLLPPLHSVKGASIRARLLNLDIVGFILGAAVWKDGRTIALFVIFGILLIAYAMQQLLFTRTHSLLYVAMSANDATLFVFLYFFPIYFQFVHNDTALEAAIRLSPYVIIMVTFNLGAGHLLSKVKRYMPIYVVSGVLLTIGGSLMVVYLKPSTSISVIYGLSIGYAVASLVVEPKDVGDAISLQNFSQLGANLILLVIAGQIFQSVAVRNLENVLADTSFSHQDIVNAVSGAQSTLFRELSGELRDQAVNAITQAIQPVLILLPVGGGVLLLVGLFMKREKLFGEIVAVGA
ncbi:major facilitator superfamily domain-containing protein [Trichoderma barbatum]